MRTLYRRLCATVVMAATWGMAWSAFGFVAGLALAVLAPPPVPLPTGVDAVLTIIRTAMNGATAGLAFGGLSGLTFAGLLRGMERRRTDRPFSVARLTAWGGMAAILWLSPWLALLQPGNATAMHGPGASTILVVTGLLGACSGWLAWRVARHADRVDAAATDASDGGAATSGPAPRASLSHGAATDAPTPTTRARARAT